MAAGVATRMYGPLDWNGGETSELVQHWPHRPRHPGQPLEPEWFSSNAEVGRQVRCHATQSFDPASKPAGQSKRITAFYSKTGVLEHRTEPQFKDFKGLQQNGLTEVNAEPLYSRPTFQGTAPLILTRGAQAKMGLRGSQSAPDLKTLRPSEVAAMTGAPHEGSGRFHPAAPPSVRSSHSKASKASRQSQKSVGSAGTGPSRQSTPSWFQRNPPAWNFDTLPTYHTASRVIGLPHQVVGPQMEIDKRAAGRSVSGFITPRTLIKNFTEDGPGGAVRPDKPTARA
jgi:hypothetical protein